MFRKNAPERRTTRRQVVLKRLQERLSMPDKEFRNTCKQFHKCPPNATIKKQLDNHRKYLKEQVAILKDRIKNQATSMK